MSVVMIFVSVTMDDSYDYNEVKIKFQITYAKL
jgi:hypothetical protein